LPFNPDFLKELGALFISGFDGKKAKGDIISAVRSGLGGVILFPPNLGAPKEILKLTQGLQKASPDLPVIISIDQEGGRVARLKAPFTEFPPMSVVGAKNDPELARMIGAAIAKELLAVGINLDFAPVMDLDESVEPLAGDVAPLAGKRRHGERVIGDRSFGADPEKVSTLGKAFIEGMQREGMMACAKHFPGHGATSLDSHVELPEVLLSGEEMRHHIAPFEAAIKGGVATIMTAHIRCHALDRYHPATLSGAILTGKLRIEMGFKGVIITDDMAMKGIADLLPPADAAALALRAGADVLLIAHDLQLAGKLRQSLHEAVRHLLIDPDEIMDKIERVTAMRTKLAQIKRPPLDVIGCREHQELAKEAN